MAYEECVSSDAIKCFAAKKGGEAIERGESLCWRDSIRASKFICPTNEVRRTDGTQLFTFHSEHTSVERFLRRSNIARVYAKYHRSYHIKHRSTLTLFMPHWTI
jgi:hypothetical protein